MPITGDKGFLWGKTSPPHSGPPRTCGFQTVDPAVGAHGLRSQRAWLLNFNRCQLGHLEGR